MESVTTTTFVCVTLDQLLNCCAHISIIRGRMSRGLGIFCKSRMMFVAETLKTYSIIILFTLINISAMRFVVKTFGKY